MSDLAATRFDAVERAEHFGLSGRFDPLKAQEAGPLPDDVALEVAKIEAADRIILHFPLWWFAPPAVIKGWCDRCLVHGRLHSVDARFDQGIGRGKSVLFCASTGASAAECGPSGKEGDSRLLLWPLAYTFRYCGYDVLEPQVLHGVHGYHEGADRERLEDRLGAELRGHEGRIGRWDDLPRMAFPADADFDDAGRLKADRTAQSPFIQPQRP